MQQRKSSASGRPSGTDGSDFSFRMVVDSRYTKVAKAKARLSKVIFAQAAIQLIGLLFAFLLSSNEGSPNRVSLSAASLGLVSLIIGEIGRKRSRVILLSVCWIASSVAVLLSVFNVVKSRSLLEVVNDPTNWEAKKIELLDIAHVLLGSLAQMYLVSTTISLIGNMSPPKKAS